MIYMGSDTAVLLDGLKNATTGSYINDATVTGYLMDLDETSLATFDFVYLTGTSGDYLGTITAAMTTSLTSCTEYIVEVIATSGGSTLRKRERQICDYEGFE